MSKQFAHRPVLSLRVGVVGHRNLKALKGFKDANIAPLKESIKKILASISKELKSDPSRRGYQERPVQYFMINSLAEGSDQLVAQVSLDASLNYQLRCTIPFPEKVYLDNFSINKDKSIRAFQELTTCKQFSCRKIVLDLPHQSQQERAEGYQTAARLLLENSDLLIAISDSTKGVQIGGTNETVVYAVKMRMPVIIINPCKPEAIQLQIYEEERAICNDDLSRLGPLLRNIVASH